MTWFLLARALFVVGLVASAVILRPLPLGDLASNAAFGLVLGGLCVALEVRLTRVSVTMMLGGLLGGAAGLLIAKTIGAALFWANIADRRIAFLHSVVLLFLTYLGVVTGVRRAEWLEPARMLSLFRGSPPDRRYKLLDTSVIIDGRIADVCETGFVDGTLVVPQFVLKELQLVADSSDALKRNRGRRGLDILARIQKMASVEVIISDVDFPAVREVDLKLIELARTLKAKIVTNDFNLNKVAQLRGIDVLNINELANALKPVVLPGEFMKVFIIKEGKEYNQGARTGRRDHGRRRQRAPVDRPHHRHRRDLGPADDGRQDDLRPPHRSRAAAWCAGQRRAAGRCRADWSGACPFPRPAGRRQGRRFEAQPSGAAGLSTHAVGYSSLPLVADGIFPDPRHRPLHDRRRDGLAHLDAVPRQPARPPLHAVVVVGHPRHHGRDGVALGHRARATEAVVRVRLEPPELLRHPRDLLARAVRHTDHREGVAGAFPFIGWHHRARHVLVQRDNPGASAFAQVKTLMAGGHSLIVFPEARAARTERRAFPQRHLPAGHRGGAAVVPIAVTGTHHVMPKNQLTTSPGHATLEVSIRSRPRACRATMRRHSPNASKHRQGGCARDQGAAC
jgi:uncharacterized protein YacL